MSEDGKPVDIKPRSRDVTEGPSRAPARAMLRAIGMTEDDWEKSQVGVASSWNEVTPCNLPLDRLAKRCKQGVRDAGGFPIEFNTIAVSDGISMGHEGMRASLVSREVIADSVETVMHAERLDGLVTFAGCDKSLPGMLMAAARIDLPSVFLYGGSILPGQHNGRALFPFHPIDNLRHGHLRRNRNAIDCEKDISRKDTRCFGRVTGDRLKNDIAGLFSSADISPNSTKGSLQAFPFNLASSRFYEYCVGIIEGSQRAAYSPIGHILRRGDLT